MSRDGPIFLTGTLMAEAEAASSATARIFLESDIILAEKSPLLIEEQGVCSKHEAGREDTPGTEKGYEPDRPRRR